MAEPLNIKKREVLIYLQESHDDTGNWPSQDQIARKLHNGKSTVSGYMKELEKEGYIRRLGKRAMRILKDPDGELLRKPLLSPLRTKSAFQESLEDINFPRVEIQAHECIIRYIKEVSEALDIAVPVPVEGIAEMLGLSVEKLPMDKGVTGQLIWREHKILVNTLQPTVQYRITIAHEIGHYILHSNIEASFCSIRARGGEEQEAEYFAARLLMPATPILNEFRKLSTKDPNEVVAQMADRFDVSSKDMRICLKNLRLIRL